MYLCKGVMQVKKNRKLVDISIKISSVSLGFTEFCN